MWHTWDRRVQGFGGKAQRKEIDRRMESEWIFESLAVEVQSGSSWLTIGAGGRLL
jgi:hypothetical protein